MIRDDDVLKLRVYGPVEIAQHENNTPSLNPGSIPLELGRRECAACKTHRPNSAVILELFQAAAYASRTHTAIIASENKLTDLRSNLG